MNRNIRARTILVAVVSVLCLITIFGPWNKPKGQSRTAADFFKPANLKQNLAENIRLGLDLRGGTHLVMQVQTDDAIKAITENNRQKAVEELKKENIPHKDVKAPDNGLRGEIIVETEKTDDHTKIRDKLLPFFGSDAWDVTTNASPPTVTFKMNQMASRLFRKEATEQAKTIIEQRIDQFGVSEPTVQLRGREEDHQILLQMPGVDNPERVKDLIKGEAKLEIRAVIPPASPYPTAEAAQASTGGAQDKDILFYNEKRRDGGTDQGYYVLEKSPVITGSDLRTARGVPSQQGLGYEVSFALKPLGAEKFGNWTGANIGKYLAVVLNNEIKSVARVNDKITDSGVITGNFTQQQAEDLGLVLRSGALPASVKYLEERSVGPSLGADSIRQGVVASIAGLILVVVVMLVYYRFSGLNAVMALLMNMVILLAGLVVFGATLTLPGIAGVILGIGMAVDSNVLIFERIREELRAGKIVRSAVDTGFDKAFVTIIDTHVTTIVSAAFLYFFGTGPIRGFAVTLVIGLLANLFTAVFVSRTMYMYVINRGGRSQETLSI
jgi:preprotein translocase subunit SecD